MLAYSKKNWELYAVILFLSDILFMALFERQFIYSLLGFYTFSLYLPISKGQLSLLLFLFLCEQFLICGHFGLPLIYLLPVTALSFKVQRLLCTSVLVPFLIFIICLSFQILAVEPYIFHIFLNPLYTMGKFIGNIVMMILFLKFRATVS